MDNNNYQNYPNYHNGFGQIQANVQTLKEKIEERHQILLRRINEYERFIDTLNSNFQLLNEGVFYKTKMVLDNIVIDHCKDMKQDFKEAHTISILEELSNIKDPMVYDAVPLNDIRETPYVPLKFVPDRMTNEQALTAMNGEVQGIQGVPAAELMDTSVGHQVYLEPQVQETPKIFDDQNPFDVAPQPEVHQVIEAEIVPVQTTPVQTDERLIRFPVPAVPMVYSMEDRLKFIDKILEFEDRELLYMDEPNELIKNFDQGLTHIAIFDEIEKSRAIPQDVLAAAEEQLGPEAKALIAEALPVAVDTNNTNNTNTTTTSTNSVGVGITQEEVNNLEAKLIPKDDEPGMLMGVPVAELEEGFTQPLVVDMDENDTPTIDLSTDDSIIGSIAQIGEVLPDPALDPDRTVLAHPDAGDPNHNEVIPEEEETIILTDHQKSVYEPLIEEIQRIVEKAGGMYHAKGESPAEYLMQLIGAAGVGKSVLTTKLIHDLQLMEYKVSVCTPTHKALGVIRAMLSDNDFDYTEDPTDFDLGYGDIAFIKTVQSFLGLKMDTENSENGEEKFTKSKNHHQVKCDVLIIDECGMVSNEQTKFLIDILKTYIKCIVFVGDEIQLTAVGDKDPSLIFQIPKKFELTEIVRQEPGNPILTIAWQLRDLILKKDFRLSPNQILHDGHHCDYVQMCYDPGWFLEHHKNNELNPDNKMIASFTNKVVDEYNTWLRYQLVTGNGGKIPDNMLLTHGTPKTEFIMAKISDPNNPGEFIDNPEFVANGSTQRSTIEINGEAQTKDINDFKKPLRADHYIPPFCIGETLVTKSSNAPSESIVHSTGTEFVIESVEYKVKKYDTWAIDINNPLGDKVKVVYNLDYWRIVDTKGRKLNVLNQDPQNIQNLQSILELLRTEAKGKPLADKKRWKPFFAMKKFFCDVNYLYSSTLHKLQGSTYGDLYFDARDMWACWKRDPEMAYRLIYVAITRPKNRVIILKGQY